VPALRALRRGRAPAPLALAAQPRIAALLAALDLVDRAVAIEALGLEALFTPDGPAPPALAAVRGCVCWFGARDPLFVRRLRAAVPTAVVAPSVGAGRVWEHLLATAAPGADARDPALTAPVAVPRDLLAEGRAALRAAGWDGVQPLVLVHPSAGGPSKRWPAEGFAHLVASLEARALQPVLHEGPVDAAPVAAVRRHRRTDGVLALVDPPLRALAGALAVSSGFLGNDSGVSHLAAAVGVPSVVLFTRPNLAWCPWAAVAHVVTVTADTLDPADVARVEAVVDARFGARRPPHT
jgi:hypothetical protein